MNSCSAFRFAVLALLSLLAMLPLLNGQTFELLQTFYTTNGASSRARLIQAGDGNFYGTTFFGGEDQAQNAGTVFKLTSEGSLTTVISFSRSNGYYPDGALVQGR